MPRFEPKTVLLSKGSVACASRNNGLGPPLSRNMATPANGISRASCVVARNHVRMTSILFLGRMARIRSCSTTGTMKPKRKLKSPARTCSPASHSGAGGAEADDARHSPARGVRVCAVAMAMQFPYLAKTFIEAVDQDAEDHGAERSAMRGNTKDTPSERSE